MKNTVKLPQPQKDIIVAALRHYQDGLRNFIVDASDQHLIYTDFDITALTGIFKDSDVDVRLELDKKVHDEFVHRHGVDFPIYN
ncbi:hypothetical protein OAB94_00895 [Flavobacteriaceae bacterium]|nr:hypothetical protein [Flavobacteriaceae bacterium]